MLKTETIAAADCRAGERHAVPRRFIRRIGLMLFVLGVAAAPALAGKWGDKYLSLAQVKRSYGFRSLSTYGKQITLATRFDTLKLEGDSRKASFNGTAIWLNAPVTRQWGQWYLLQADAEKTVGPLLNPSNALAAADYRVVVLDAGHGGDDKGASDLRRGALEKKLVLEIAGNVAAILRKYNVDARLTRSNDRNLSLDDRCRLAGNWGADLFVSIHINSAPNASPAGIETYIVPPAGCLSTADSVLDARDRIAYPANRYDGANMILGYNLQKSMLKFTHAEDRGVRHSRFYVIRGVPCPAALVECGFLSNRQEKEKLLTKAYRDQIVKGIAEGILFYLNTARRAHKTGK